MARLMFASAKSSLMQPRAAPGISFVGSASAPQSANTVVLPDIAGLMGGDFVVGIVSGTNINQDGTIADWQAAGWTTPGQIQNGTFFVFWFWKRMGASPSAALTFRGSGIINTACCAITVAFRGINRGETMDLTQAAGVSIAAGSAINPPSVTPNFNDCVMIAGGGINDTDSAPGTIAAYSTPIAIAVADVNPSCAAVCYRVLDKGLGVPQDPPQFSAFPVASGKVGLAFTFALRPA